MKTSTTQKKIAADLGISQPFLNLILAGKRRPSPLMALMIEKKSGINRNIWLYDSPKQIKRHVEKLYGKIKINKKKAAHFSNREL